VLSATFLMFAGLIAAVVGTAGGITSLISYPALLAVGIGPFAANVTNAVSLISSGLASSLSSGPELREHRARLRGWAVLAVAGGTTGAVLLLVTPPGVFSWIVPFLIALASVLLLAQPRITSWHRARPRAGGTVLVTSAIFGVSVYSGYFGAGAGVLIIAVVLILVDADLARANALKNFTLLVADILPGIIFAVFGPVVWRAAIPLAIGACIGGLLGPAITRRARPTVLRILVALMGFGLAAWLVVKAVRT
jgi:uncharacterized protein